MMNIEYKENSTELAKPEMHYAIKDGKAVHVSEVDSGLECGCVCPFCNASLIAKKGDVRAHHFAHHNADDCEYGAETALHLMAKQLIADHKQVMLPAIEVKECMPDLNGEYHQLSQVISAKVSEFKDIEVEPYADSYRPDLTGFLVNDDVLDIEILVTHKVDDKKANEQAERYRDMLEIDLSDVPRTIEKECLKNLVLYSACRKMIFSREANDLALRLRLQLEEKITGINSTITQAEQSKKNNLIPVKSRANKILLGYKVGEGYNAKRQSNFNIAHLFYCKPVQTNSTGNFNLQSSKGFEIGDVNIKSTLLDQLENLEFPVEATLEFEMKPGFKRDYWLVSNIIISE